MCTIVALHGLRPDLPLVIAANRDEAYARPATGAIRLSESPRIVGGRDTLAGGTWMGVTPSGLLVGVTNQRTGKPPGADKRSRGALVMAALAAGTLAEVRALLAATDARLYNPFNLLVGDGHELLVAVQAAGSQPGGQGVALGQRVASVAPVLGTGQIGVLAEESSAGNMALGVGLDAGLRLEQVVAAVDDHAAVDRHAEFLGADQGRPGHEPNPPRAWPSAGSTNRAAISRR